MYLLAPSCHPGHTKRNIAYSQALRICRICSDRNVAKLRCDQLQEYLVKRGHSSKKTRQNIKRAIDTFCAPGEVSSGQSVFGMNTSATVSSASRSQLTFKVTSFVIDYHPGLPNITVFFVNISPFFIGLKL